MMKIFYSAIMIFCFTTCAYAIDAPQVSSSVVMQNSNVISMSYWNAGESYKLFCVLTVEKETGDDKIPTRELKIYKEIGQKLTRLYNYQTPDSPISMYPLGEFGARFFTAWTGGSSHHFTVFAFVNNNVIKVLDVSSKLMPEFAWDKNGNEIILITHLSWQTDSKTGTQIQIPVSTKIYKWNAVKYEMIKKVPWQKRFETIQSLIN